MFQDFFTHRLTRHQSGSPRETETDQANKYILWILVSDIAAMSYPQTIWLMSDQQRHDRDIDRHRRSCERAWCGPRQRWLRFWCWLGLRYLLSIGLSNLTLLTIQEVTRHWSLPAEFYWLCLDYIHRVGRTARGVCIRVSLYSSRTIFPSRGLPCAIFLFETWCKA